MLGGGIQAGLLTDIFGPPRSGKSQICFSLCAQCVSRGGFVLFVDTTGAFRPERVVEIARSESVLRNVNVVRARTLGDQQDALNLILEINPTLVIVDSLTALFSSQISGVSRHLLLMRFLRDLAYVTITGGYHVVFTNMVRSQIQAVEQNGHSESDRETPRYREYLGSSVSLYSHMRLMLDVVEQAERLVIKARCVMPRGGAALFRVVPAGMEEVS